MENLANGKLLLPCFGANSDTLNGGAALDLKRTIVVLSSTAGRNQPRWLQERHKVTVARVVPKAKVPGVNSRELNELTAVALDQGYWENKASDEKYKRLKVTPAALDFLTENHYYKVDDNDPALSIGDDRVALELDRYMHLLSKIVYPDMFAPVGTCEPPPQDITREVLDRMSKEQAAHAKKFTANGKQAQGKPTASASGTRGDEANG